MPLSTISPDTFQVPTGTVLIYIQNSIIKYKRPVGSESASGTTPDRVLVRLGLTTNDLPCLVYDVDFSAAMANTESPSVLQNVTVASAHKTGAKIVNMLLDHKLDKVTYLSDLVAIDSWKHNHSNLDILAGLALNNNNVLTSTIGNATYTYVTSANLATALSAYALSDHTHTGVYAPVTHSHAITDVTDLSTTLANKSDTNHNHDSVYAAILHEHLITDVSGLSTTLSGKANAVDVYTKSDIDQMMATKANTVSARQSISFTSADLVNGYYTITDCVVGGFVVLDNENKRVMPDESQSGTSVVLDFKNWEITGTWTIHFVKAVASTISRSITPLTGTSLTPVHGGVFTYTIQGGETIAISNAPFVQGEQMEFELYIDIPTGVTSSFSIPAVQHWLKTANFSETNKRYCVAFRWDGVALLANVAYSYNLS